MRRRRPHRPTVLSLFTGAGGLDLGLEEAGFQTIAAIESDPTCARTLGENRPGWKLLNCRNVIEAARVLTPRHLGLADGELDVIAGGPPCQPFSVAGQWTSSGRRGMADSRASTVPAMLTIVEVFLPRVIIIENVVGFLSGKVSVLPFIERRLGEINKRHNVCYRLDSWVVDSADYGVPQRRRRAIAVAVRDGRRFVMPPATHRQAPITAWDAIGDLQETDPPQCTGGWAELLPSIPEGQNYQYLSARGGGDELFGYRTRYWSFLLKLAKDRPSWTLPASPGPATGPFHWDNRPLSVRERMRLQSFPDEWHLVGTLGAQLKQVGNATPPLLSEVIGQAIMNQVISPGARYPKSLRLLRSKATSTPPPCLPVAVPERFRHLIGAKQAHRGAGRGPSPRES